MIELLHTAEGTFPSGDKDIVGLSELGLEQAIKDIIDVDFLQAAPGACLSHAFSVFPGKPSVHPSRLTP
jgi:hypothetical protein